MSDATAIALQEYITSFAASGVPGGPSLPQFPLYGNDSRILNLNATSITEITDPIAKERCLWWQKALYYRRYRSADVLQKGSAEASVHELIA